MGGGGGGYFGGPVDKNSLERLRQDAETRAASQGLEAEVSGYLREILSTVNNRDVETVREHLEEIKNALDDYVEGTEDLLYGGSVAKKTYVDGFSDIDSLVLLTPTSIEGKTPKQLASEFYRVIRDRISTAEIKEVEKGSLAVTVTFHDGTVIQLLPAYRVGKGFAISNRAGTGWREIKPKEFSQMLSKVNEKQDYQLVPTIKLAKLINYQLPEDRSLDGYHLEALAVKAFEQYKGEKTPKAMLYHFFNSAAEHVKTPIVDETGQSRHVDTELGVANSLQRLKVADTLGRIARRMRNAASLDQWRSILAQEA